MSIAVIKTGGKQYLVKKDQIIKIEKIASSSQTMEFIDLLANKKVTAKVLENGKDRKIRVFKFKNKTGYRKTYGHRQPYTKLMIESINE